MDEAFYSWLHRAPTAGALLGTTYSNDEMATYRSQYIIDAIQSDNNVAYIADMIIGRADPLRNGASAGQRMVVIEKVKQMLQSWQNLGKFESHTITINGQLHHVSSISPVTLLDHYNTEFVSSFADTILPTSDVAKVVSVTNPDGLYAQQERVIKMTAKPVPFYERAIYRRLNDWNLNTQLDETEAPFYRMDKNPRLSDAERQKTNTANKALDTYLDREGLAYRMLPK